MKQYKKMKQPNFVQKVWNLMAPFHRDFYGIFVVTLFFETIRMGGPYLFGKILDLLVRTNGLVTFETAAFVVGGLAGVRIISLAIDHLTDWVILSMLFRSEQYISTVAYQKLVELSIDYHERVSTGKKISLVNRGTDKLLDLIQSFTFEFQPIVLQLMVSTTFIFLTSWHVGIVFGASLIPFILITFKIFQSTQPMRERRHDAHELSSSEVGDTMTNITVVKGFAQEDRENSSFSTLRGFITSISKAEFKKRMFAGFSRNVLIEIFYIALLSIGLWEIKMGALTIGGLVFLINMIERGYSNIYRLGRIYQRITDAKEPVDSLTTLMATTSSVQNRNDALLVKQIDGDITFKNVSFSYNKKKVLENISFSIPAGSFTALVGKSGSGKSTIAKLLSRYYDPTEGTVLIDGEYDLRELDITSFRQNTAIVFQDSPVPNRKIWEVISYAAGRKTWSKVKDQVIEAARLAHAHEFISELEEGYNTLIGERGVKLSGGQRQRLAIARALFAKPKILIMDEPTSHLDTVSEAMIQQALEEISHKRTLTKIIIAHRLSTVQHADQILVMDRGRLIERGTHTQLLRKNGVYAKIVKQSMLRD
jgi:ABC-type multidrug transport system fused ATPase/permease subunit